MTEPRPAPLPVAGTPLPGAGNAVSLAQCCEIPYRPYAGTESWIRHRFSQDSRLKTLFTMLAVSLFVLGVIGLCLVFAAHIWSALGGQAISAAEYAARKAANEFIMACFSLAGAAVLAVASCLYLSQPTHLRLSARGVQFISRRGPFSFPGAAVAWEKISAITLQRRLGQAAVLDNYLCFWQGKREKVRIKLAALGGIEEKAALGKAIEAWGLEAVADASVFEALEAPRDHAYTELWLQALSAPPKRESLRPLMEGTCLAEGRYQIRGCLGAGGQGTAYLADSQLPEQPLVVLKEFILPVYVDVSVRRQALKSFESEARILKQLNHRQVVRLLDFFTEDQRGYLVLEYIEGLTLKRKVELEGPLGELAVRELAGQMCEILGYLHSLIPPVVHRDFTPDNLILHSEGILTLVDFNVAQQTDSPGSSTVVGKHAYLPPEQFRGCSSPQSDIYAMGGTLHFLLTGEDPEPICANHPQAQVSEISDEMDLIVAKATAIDLRDRYQNSRAVREDLDRLAMSK